MKSSLRQHAAVLLIVTGGWTLIANIIDIGWWYWTDTYDVILGAVLLIGGILIVRNSGVAVGPRQVNVLWPALAGIAAACWVAGEWFPWSGFQARDRNGRPVASEVESCCWAFEDGVWQGYVYDTSYMLFIVIAAVVIALIKRASVSGAGLIGLGVLYLDEPASWLQELANPRMSGDELDTYGFDIDKLRAAGQTVTQSAEAGGWVALAALVALILIGIARSRARDPEILTR